MTRRIVVSSLVLLLVVIMTASMVAQTTPPQFSADLKFTGFGTTLNGKLYFGAPKMRVEMTSAGHLTQVITDTQRKESYFLIPEQRGYIETSMDTRKENWRMYDATNPCVDVPDATCKKIGEGVADGRTCDRWVFNSGQEAWNTLMTLWIDQKTGIPVRIEVQGSVTELTNIKEEPQSSSLFEIPEGYKKLNVRGHSKGN